MRRTHTAAATGAMMWLAVLAASPAAAQTLETPVSHQSSTVGFTVFAKALFTFKEEGLFKKFDGQVAYDPADPTATRMALTVYTASIDTRNTEHDDMLRSPDFFDVDQYPTMRFVSTGVTVQRDGGLLVSGDLTIRGISKRVDVPVRIQPQTSGKAAGPRFDTTFEIDRTEFGLNGSPKFAGFNVSIAKNVKIHLAIALAMTPPRFQ